MLKIPISLKWLIAISVISIGIIIIFTSFYFLQDHQYHLLINWTGFILFFIGIVLAPFSTESIEKENAKN